MAEEEFSAEAFANALANEEEEFSTGCPLSCKETLVAFCQTKDRAPQNKFRTQPELCVEKPHTFLDSAYELITKNDKIYVPKCLQHKCAEWCHLMLMHPGEQRLELTTAQHNTARELACEPHVHVCANSVKIAQQARSATQDAACFHLSPIRKSFHGTRHALTRWAHANSATQKSRKHALNFNV